LSAKLTKTHSFWVEAELWLLCWFI